MRIIDEIPHSEMKITIFQMNQKYIIKFEKGPLEQVYKFSELDIVDLSTLKAAILEQLCTSTNARFNEMILDYNNCLS